jgi:serine/threonine-protein kinase
MAEVHIGHDTRLGRTVAIKILRSDLARDPAFLARFRREAQSAAALNHPAIVAVYDTGEDTYTDPTTLEQRHIPYIVMEYVEGHTVREILNHGDAVPIDEAVEITSGVLSALEYSHHAGIIHRDIKPGNVMITPTGAVKVMDFGIARAVADSAATMTQTQAVIGTAQYLSPEQARGETVDARSDIYSTGCLLFELLTGRPPFVGDSPVAVAYQHVGQTPVAPSEIASDVPAALDQINLKALAKERSQRYSSAAEFRADLDAFLAGQPLAPLPVAATTITPSVNHTQVMHPGVAPTAVYQGQPHNSTVVMSPGALAVPNGQVTGTHTAVNALPGSHPPPPQWGPLSQDPHLLPPEEIVPVPEPSNSRRILLWTLIPLGIIAIGLIAFFATRGSGSYTPPGVDQVMVPTFAEGVTQVEACNQIRAVDLICDPQMDTTSNEPDGTFLRQYPAGGTEVAAGSSVSVWFSGGPTTVIVPNLEGMAIDQAQAALEDRGLVLGTVEHEASVTQPEGNVVRSDPPANFGVNRGESINVYLSNGLVALPDLVGLTQAQAQTQLTALMLTWRLNTQYSATATPGTVLSQSPMAGDVAQGTEIQLTIAEAPPTQILTVPSVVGQLWSAVQGQFENFNVQTSLQSHPTYPVGAVISTNPGGGASVEAGSNVAVVLSTGPEMVTVPSVVGQSFDAANGTLSGLGLTVSRQDSAPAEGAPEAGTVTGQSPSPGSSVAAGSTITLTVSGGAPAPPAPEG